MGLALSVINPFLVWGGDIATLSDIYHRRAMHVGAEYVRFSPWQAHQNKSPSKCVAI